MRLTGGDAFLQLDLDARRIAEIHAGKNLEEHFEALFDQYFDRVVSFFIRRGFSHDESTDLAQETFVRAFRKIGQFRGDGRFRDWLFRVAASTWKNRLRSLSAAKRDAAEVSLSWLDPDDQDREQEGTALRRGASQLDAVLQQERADELRRAVLSLPPQMRRCVFLHIDQDLRYPEIAARLKLTTGTVKTQIHLAKRRLKERLGNVFAEAIK